MPDSFAESAEGVVLIANGIDPVVKWDGFTEAADLAGIVPPDEDTTPAISGSGTGSITGTYRAYLRWVDSAGNVSNLSEVSNAVAVTSVGQIDYSNLPVPTTQNVARRQILRNTDGQLTTFYVDVDDTQVTSTTATGTKTDAQLAASEAVPLLNLDGSLFANRHNPPPDHKPFIAPHIGRMFFWGSQPYAEGSIQVTFGSTTVTGIATQWPANFAGRFLYVTGSDRSYEIDSVDPVEQTLELTEAFEGATDKFAMYAIRPAPAEENLLYWSEPGLPESVPPINAIEITQDGDAGTALANFGSFLYIFKRRHTYRLTAQADPAEDGFVFFALGRGCINHRCWLIVEEQIYVLDENGVYRTGGGDQVEQISTEIQDRFRRNEPGAINWAASRFFHASYDPVGETIRWHVSFHGEYLPRHALCLHYKTGKWWTETNPVPISGAVIGRIGRPTGGWSDQGEQLFLGGPAGEIYAHGGTLDGVDSEGNTTRGKVTSSGVDSLTDSAAKFSTSWKNIPVCITAGRGAGQVRVVVSATATKLKVNETWAVKPDTTSVYQVGGIPYRYQSGRLQFAPGEGQGGRSITLYFEPTEYKLTANLKLIQDFSSTARKMGRRVDAGQRHGVRADKADTKYVFSLAEENGCHKQRFDGHKEGDTNSPRLVKIEIEGVSGPDQVEFGDAVLMGVVR